MTPPNTSDRELRVRHLIRAPKDLVFDAWTRPEHVDRWMGPRGFTTTTASLDFRVGGEWHFTMKHEEYGEFPNRVRYLEIVPGERLVYDHDAGVDGDPNGFRTVVTFTARGAHTEVELHTTLATVAALEEAKRFGAEVGGEQTLTKLGEHVTAEGGGLEIVRDFKAPVALVWRAWTEAERLAKWWGPAGFGMEVARLDLRPGGVFHYAMSAPAGSPMAGTMWGRFVFRVVEAPHRLEWITSFSDEAGGIARHPMAANWPLEVYNSLELEAIEGGTRLTMRGRPLRANAEENSMFTNFRANVTAGTMGTLNQLEAFLQEG